jgi:hypothetical protein
MSSGCTKFFKRISAQSMPSLRAAISIIRSTRKHCCILPYDRFGPTGHLFVVTARISIRKFLNVYPAVE